MKITFDKSFNEHSIIDAYNRIFLKAIVENFLKMYEENKTMSLIDFLIKLGCKNVHEYDEKNIVWVKGKTKDPDIKIDGNVIEIN